jgi:hypothetical protein
MGSRRRGVLGVLVASWTMGCATIVQGPHQSVEISSDPPGARALVLPANIELITPGEVNLERKLAHTVLFELDGYRPATGYLDRTSSHTTLGNVILGGFVGMAIDRSSGAIYRLIPDPLHVVLDPEVDPADLPD